MGPGRLTRICHWDNFVYAGHTAAVTSNLGFVMSVNSSFEHPYAAARQLATLDNFNRGRTALRRRGVFRTEYAASTLQGLLDTDDVY
ncbi:LLM class flavin-dependent oxidoreductase [Streptomyces shenzhenensis]